MTDDFDDFVVIAKPCAVTMFDAHLEVRLDGRARGLWFFLRDRRDGVNVDEGALMEWPEMEQVYSALGRALKQEKKMRRRRK